MQTRVCLKDDKREPDAAPYSSNLASVNIVRRETKCKVKPEEK